MLVCLDILKDEHSRLTSGQSMVDGYLLVCSVNSRQSFEMIHVLNEKILEHANAQVPRLIVMNKSDLPPRFVRGVVFFLPPLSPISLHSLSLSLSFAHSFMCVISLSSHQTTSSDG